MVQESNQRIKKTWLFAKKKKKKNFKPFRIQISSHLTQRLWIWSLILLESLNQILYKLMNTKPAELKAFWRFYGKLGYMKMDTFQKIKIKSTLPP